MVIETKTQKCGDKWPRHYAEEIIVLPDRDSRRVALEEVPEGWRDWVFEYVKNHFDMRRARNVEKKKRI